MSQAPNSPENGEAKDRGNVTPMAARLEQAFIGHSLIEAAAAAAQDQLEMISALFEEVRLKVTEGEEKLKAKVQAWAETEKAAVLSQIKQLNEQALNIPNGEFETEKVMAESDLVVLSQTLGHRELIGAGKGAQGMLFKGSIPSQPRAAQDDPSTGPVHSRTPRERRGVRLQTQSFQAQEQAAFPPRKNEAWTDQKAFSSKTRAGQKKQEAAAKKEAALRLKKQKPSVENSPYGLDQCLSPEGEEGRRSATKQEGSLQFLSCDKASEHRSKSSVPTLRTFILDDYGDFRIEHDRDLIQQSLETSMVLKSPIEDFDRTSDKNSKARTKVLARSVKKGESSRPNVKLGATMSERRNHNGLKSLKSIQNIQSLQNISRTGGPSLDFSQTMILKKDPSFNSTLRQETSGQLSKSKKHGGEGSTDQVKLKMETQMTTKVKTKQEKRKASVAADQPEAKKPKRERMQSPTISSQFQRAGSRLRKQRVGLRKSSKSFIQTTSNFSRRMEDSGLTSLPGKKQSTTSLAKVNEVKPKKKEDAKKSGLEEKKSKALQFQSQLSPIADCSILSKQLLLPLLEKGEDSPTSIRKAEDSPEGSSANSPPLQTAEYDQKQSGKTITSKRKSAFPGTQGTASSRNEQKASRTNGSTLFGSRKPWNSGSVKEEKKAVEKKGSKKGDSSIRAGARLYSLAVANQNVREERKSRQQASKLSSEVKTVPQSTKKELATMPSINFSFPKSNLQEVPSGSLSFRNSGEAGLSFSPLQENGPMTSREPEPMTTYQTKCLEDRPHMPRGTSAVNSSRERKQWKKPESRTASQNKSYPAAIASIILDPGSPPNRDNIPVIKREMKESESSPFNSLAFTPDHVQQQSLLLSTTEQHASAVLSSANLNDRDQNFRRQIQPGIITSDVFSRFMGGRGQEVSSNSPRVSNLPELTEEHLDSKTQQMSQPIEVSPEVKLSNFISRPNPEVERLDEQQPRLLTENQVEEVERGISGQFTSTVDPTPSMKEVMQAELSATNLLNAIHTARRRSQEGRLQSAIREVAINPKMETTQSCPRKKAEGSEDDPQVSNEEDNEEGFELGELRDEDDKGQQESRIAQLEEEPEHSQGIQKAEGEEGKEVSQECQANDQGTLGEVTKTESENARSDDEEYSTQRYSRETKLQKIQRMAPASSKKQSMFRVAASSEKKVADEHKTSFPHFKSSAYLLQDQQQ